MKFIFGKFLSDYIEPVSIVHTERAWKLKDVTLKHYGPVVEGVKRVLEKEDKPLHLADIVNELRKESVELEELAKEVEDLDSAVHSCLEVSKDFKKNLFDKWGLHEWRSVNPRRMRDKIYLVMQKDAEPLHYKKIAERINEEKFDNKVAHPATIHNELILDERFVLIGRGIYALQEWGYKPGVIADVIADVLEEAGRPLTKEEITIEVLKHRVVKEGSINLTLSDRNRFEKVSGNRYVVKKVVDTEQ